MLPRKIREWSHRGQNASHVNILIAGSSYMRQVYETIVCRYRNLIRGGFLVVNPPDMSLATMKKYPLYGYEKMGHIVSMESMRGGCHGRKTNDRFFEPGVVIPRRVHSNCADDMSMVEFPGNLRIYYMFRHFQYGNDTVATFQRMGLNLTDVDALVTNNHEQDNGPLLAHVTAPVFHVEELLPHLVRQQIKHIGRFFGADNVGMDHIPDGHPCMPGVPDDEADILLLQLAHKLVTLIT